ncbi:MAG TPA: NAD(P) transhydrogenase subunit alpha [Alphaproteobacteria bacterium]
MDPNSLTQSAVDLANEAAALAAKAAALAQQTTMMVAPEAAGGGVDMLTMGLTVFVLACFVGYYVVWRVTPALHSPLMSVTNAISSVIIVGALLAAGASQVGFSETMGLLAVVLASVNIFGGFVVTQRMLGKFKKKA